MENLGLTIFERFLMPSSTYQLLFTNDSGNAGTVCIFQDGLNAMLPASSPYKVLAWKVKKVNAAVQVLFQWQVDYAFVWFDYSNPRTQEILRIAQDSQIQMPFDKNQYGYLFGETSASNSAALSINQGSNIPSENKAVVGIGMNGSGTLAYAAQPNLTQAFNPVDEQALIFYISFGDYNFTTNSVIDPQTLNSPRKFSFTHGVFQLTATLNSTNSWVISPGIDGLSLKSAQTMPDNGPEIP